MNLLPHKSTPSWYNTLFGVLKHTFNFKVIVVVLDLMNTIWRKLQWLD